MATRSISIVRQISGNHSLSECHFCLKGRKEARRMSFHVLETNYLYRRCFESEEIWYLQKLHCQLANLNLNVSVSQKCPSNRADRTQRYMNLCMKHLLCSKIQNYIFHQILVIYSTRIIISFQYGIHSLARVKI